MADQDFVTTNQSETEDPFEIRKDPHEFDGFDSMFDDEAIEGYYKPPPADTFQLYTRTHLQRKAGGVDGEGKEDEQGHPEIKIHMVGSHPLWGHLLWNAAIVIAEEIDARRIDVRDKRVLELGAGSALPSLVALWNQCSFVAITDYPDAPLLEAIQRNIIANNYPESLQSRVSIAGHLWGKDAKLLNSLQPSSISSSSFEKIDSISSSLHPSSPSFDIVILADVIFNHSQHDQLLRTCKDTLARRKNPDTPLDSREPKVWVSFTHHKPHLAHKDLQFFEKAKNPPFNFKVEHINSSKRTPMFEVDYGPEDVRSTVHVYTLAHKEEKEEIEGK